MFTRKHHCRCCGKIFCWKCSKYDSILPFEFGYKLVPQKVCINCYNTLSREEKPIVDFKTQIQNYMRKVLYFQLKNHVFNIGIRELPGKGNSLITSHNKDYLLTKIELSESLSAIWDISNMKLLLNVLTQDNHFFIEKVHSFSILDNEAYIIRNAYTCSLRDKIYKVENPFDEYVKKYRGNGQPLENEEIRNIGRNILIALQYLYSIDFPYPHLHSGNVMLEGDKIYLSELENSIFLLEPFHADKIREYPSNEPEIICFGCILIEMVEGYYSNNLSIDSLTHLNDPDLSNVLQKVFCDTGVTIDELLDHPYFNENKDGFNNNINIKVKTKNNNNNKKRQSKKIPSVYLKLMEEVKLKLYH